MFTCTTIVTCERLHIALYEHTDILIDNNILRTCLPAMQWNHSLARPPTRDEDVSFLSKIVYSNAKKGEPSVKHMKPVVNYGIARLYALYVVINASVPSQVDSNSMLRVLHNQYC